MKFDAISLTERKPRPEIQNFYNQIILFTSFQNSRDSRNMNFCLGFKKSKHSEAFVSDFSTRVKRKFINGLIINGWIAVTAIAQRIVSSSGSPTEIWSFTRISITLFWILALFFVSFKLEKFKKCHKLIFLLFDLVQCFGSLSLLPIFIKTEVKYELLSPITNSWCSGLQYIAGILLIESWQIKVLHLLCQIVFFSVYIGIVKSDATPIVYLVCVFFMYAFFFYFREKFTRMEFLEKRKIYEDSEAVKSILDDITEGIVIINQQKKILYFNQPVQKMFQLDNSTIDDLFCRLKIKSMTSNGSSNSPTLQTFEKNFQQVISIFLFCY